LKHLHVLQVHSVFVDVERNAPVTLDRTSGSRSVVWKCSFIVETVAAEVFAELRRSAAVSVLGFTRRRSTDVQNGRSETRRGCHVLVRQMEPNFVAASHLLLSAIAQNVEILNGRVSLQVSRLRFEAFCLCKLNYFVSVTPISQ